MVYDQCMTVRYDVPHTVYYSYNSIVYDYYVACDDVFVVSYCT